MILSFSLRFVSEAFIDLVDHVGAVQGALLTV
jgi:hypothetical protein